MLNFSFIGCFRFRLKYHRLVSAHNRGQEKLNVGQGGGDTQDYHPGDQSQSWVTLIHLSFGTQFNKCLLRDKVTYFNQSPHLFPSPYQVVQVVFGKDTLHVTVETYTSKTATRGQPRELHF